MTTEKILAILLSAILLSAPASLNAGNTNADKLVLAAGKQDSTGKLKPASGNEEKSQSCRNIRKKWDPCAEGWACFNVCPQKEDQLDVCISKDKSCP